MIYYTIVLSIFALAAGFFLWLYWRERTRHQWIYAPHKEPPPLYPLEGSEGMAGVLRFYFKNARVVGFVLPERTYSAFLAGWNSAALWIHRHDQPCPVCGYTLDVRFAERKGCISATLRCPGCDSSIGWPELSVVYRGDEQGEKPVSVEDGN